MFRDDLIKQAVHRPPNGSNQMEDLGTFRVGLKSPLHRADLSANAAHASEKVGFALSEVGHRDTPYPYERSMSSVLSGPRLSFRIGALSVWV